MLELVRRAAGRWRRRRSLPDLATGRRGLLVLAVYLASISACHIGAMMAFEGLAFGDAVWLTATTMTTVGYGDLSAQTEAGRWATVLLIYIGGIFALGKGAADWFDYRAERRALRERGRWRWRLKDHVLIVNAPTSGAETYFETLLRQFRQTDWGRDRGVLILATCWPDGLPVELRRMGAVHVHGRGGSEGKLQDGDATDADAVVILAADETDPGSDGTAFDLVHRLVEMGVQAPIVVECVDDRNRERLRAAGAGTVMRPMRGYPEMLVRSLIAPGSESIIENLFTRHGDECVRFELRIAEISWGKLASGLLCAGVGTALAYARASDGFVLVNPRPDERVDAEALYVLVKEGYEPSMATLQQLIGESGQPDA